MNWKKTLNPWGYARGLEIAIEAANGTIDNLTVSYGALHLENIDLLGQVSSLNELLRIADERADKNAVACDAAHDDKPVDIVWAEPSEVGNAIKRLRERPVNVGAIPEDKRRTKAKTPAQIEADEAREAENHVAKAYQERDARGKFKGKS